MAHGRSASVEWMSMRRMGIITCRRGSVCRFIGCSPQDQELEPGGVRSQGWNARAVHFRYDARAAEAVVRRTRRSVVRCSKSDWPRARGLPGLNGHRRVAVAGFDTRGQIGTPLASILGWSTIRAKSLPAYN